MGKRYVIVCGGTGGHLTPGIAIAQRWLSIGAKTDLIISQKSIDRELSSQYPEMNFHAAPGRPFSLNPLKLVLFLKSMFSGVLYAWKQLRAIRPQAIVAFGGFTSVSFALVAKVLSIPIFLHEANRVPGRSVRFLSYLADKIYLPEGVRLKGLSLLQQADCPLPLRLDIKHIQKEEVREKLGISRQAKLLVIVGGSQGASVLNTWIKKHLNLFLADGISVYCITGPRKMEGLVSQKKLDSVGNMVEAKFFEFHHDISKLFSAADLVVSRAGAGTIAELNECLCPAILIPYTFAAGDHQTANARYQEMKGAGMIIAEKNMAMLYREVTEMIFNDWLIRRMRDNIKAMNSGDAANYLIQDIEKTLSGEVRSTALRGRMMEGIHE